MKSLWKSFIVVGALFLVFAMGGCAPIHYTDGTTSGYCIGLTCPIQALITPGGVNGGGGKNPNSDFVHPNPDTFTYGKSTYVDVTRLAQDPNTTSRMMVKDKKIYIITYLHADLLGEPFEAGVIPAHALTYYFLESTFLSNYTLIGQQYSSSYKSDNTNFDETKVSDIIKGKSTRAEVVQLLGKPSASFAAPMVEAIAYSYTTTRVGASGDAKARVFTKTLKVAFDDKGLASDVNYATSGSR